MADLFGATVEPVFYRNAAISDCGLYRYRLERRWSDAPLLPFISLNSSTADAELDDPTVRRDMGFARREGAGGTVLGNLYAYRATDPADLEAAGWPAGPDNERHLMEICDVAVAQGMPIVCAWGVLGNTVSAFLLIDKLRDRGGRLVCLGRTKDGSPRHPLYVKADQPLEPFP